MFYAQFVLSKKGPLSKIWLAAHWEKKLSKAQIYETNVQDACDEIIQPKGKMALRTTGHLLLGIVRIYSRKAKYLLADCNEAFLKIKMAFRPGMAADAFEDNSDINTPAIQLPEVYTDFDSALPDFNDIDLQHQLHINQSRIDDITLKEDLAVDSNAFGNDFMMDDFGESKLGGGGLNFDFDDNFGLLAPGEDMEQIRDASGVHVPNVSRGDIREPTPSLEGARAPGANVFEDDDIGGVDDFDDMDERMSIFNENQNHMEIDAPGAEMPDDMGGRPMDMTSEAGTESYTIGQMDASSTITEVRRVGRPRKRRLIIDEPKNITGDEMKSQMANYTDTLQPLDLAPPTRKLMKLRECGNVEKLYHQPGSETIRAKPLVKFYQCCLVPHVRTQEEPADIRRELEMSDTVDDTDAISQSVTQPDFDDFDMGGFDDQPFDNDPTPMAMADPVQDEPADTSLEEKKEDREDGKSKKERRSRQVQEEEDLGEGDEEHRFTKRTQNVLHSIAQKLRSSGEDQILLSDMLTKASNKKTAAQKFYTLLVLKKWQAIEVAQGKPFDDISITSGPKLDESLAH
ncbi:unnamed protein product, partial [Mesorhabditis spiculigera]